MFAQAPSFKEFLSRREKALNSEKPKEKSENGNLYNDKTFYNCFTKDLLEAKREVIIYSPFVSKFRTDYYKQTIEKLRNRNIEVFIFTRPVETYDLILQDQIRIALERYEELGVCVFYLSGNIHEKVAIIDREILWEGSLNILSHRASHEMMRRISEENSAMQVLAYLKLQNKLAEGYKLRYEKLCQSLAFGSKEIIKLKIKMFLIGMMTAMVVLWLFTILISVVSSLQGTNALTRIVRLLVVKQ